MGARQRERHLQERVADPGEGSSLRPEQQGAYKNAGEPRERKSSPAEGTKRASALRVGAGVEAAMQLLAGGWRMGKFKGDVKNKYISYM